MMKRLFALAAVVLVGCSNAPTIENNISDSFLDRFNGQPAQSTRFAALRTRSTETLQIGFLERDLTGAVLLEQRSGAFETWLSPDDTTITFQSGLLHSTRGLGAGLLASDLSQSIAFITSREPGFTDRLHTFLTGEDIAVTRTFRCAVTREGMRDVTLNSGTVQTQLMAEDCKSLDEEFRNLYWVDVQGTVVQSRQWTGVFLGPISTRVVR